MRCQAKLNMWLAQVCACVNSTIFQELWPNTWTKQQQQNRIPIELIEISVLFITCTKFWLTVDGVLTRHCVRLAFELNTPFNHTYFSGLYLIGCIFNKGTRKSYTAMTKNRSRLYLQNRTKSQPNLFSACQSATVCHVSKISQSIVDSCDVALGFVQRADDTKLWLSIVHGHNLINMHVQK